MLAAAAVLALSCSRPSLREEESAWFPIIIALNSSGLKKYSYRHVFATAMHYLVKQVGKNIIRTAVLMYRQSCILFFCSIEIPDEFWYFWVRYKLQGFLQSTNRYTFFKGFVLV